MLAGSGDRFVREGKRSQGAVDTKGEHEVSYQLTKLSFACAAVNGQAHTGDPVVWNQIHTLTHTLIQSLRPR